MRGISHVLKVQLQSVQPILLVLVTAPLSIVGITRSLLAFHLPFGFATMLGVISLTGMTMRNSLILVDQIDQDVKGGSDYQASGIRHNRAS